MARPLPQDPVSTLQQLTALELLNRAREDEFPACAEKIRVYKTSLDFIG